MTALIVVLMFVAFVAIDFLVREATRRHRELKARKAREEVLNVAVRRDFSQEAKSLKRVEVEAPLARILAVDDEPVILDAFRRILVLEGFNVDTVESGPEALGLAQRHDYDFVFTDLKMPDMDGVEVVKAVKHLRPDVDVVVVTGYATIETAVATLQYGAIEYVQKPFTAEELADFARRLVIKRRARLEAHAKPSVRVVSPSMAEEASCDDYVVPGGAFLSSGHAWVRIEPGGQVRVGLDDFARKALGRITAVGLPDHGATLRRGDPLFTLKNGPESLVVSSPLGGKVSHRNEELLGDPGRILESPYERGWVCLMSPTDLAAELSSLRIGKPVVDWYQEEILRLRQMQDARVPRALSWVELQAFFKQSV